MNSNFLFLTERFPALEKMGSLAEIYLYSDPNTCLYKMGSLAETIVNYMFELDNLKPPPGNDNTHANRIKILQRQGMISKDISDIFYILRIRRNEAVHGGYDSLEECITLIEMTYTLSVWFMQAYGDNEYEPIPFIVPADIRKQPDFQKLLDENERLSAELEKAQAAALSKMAHMHIHASERRQRAEKATRNIKLSEREVRYILDEQLRKVGWEADTINLRYSKGTRPEKGRDIAIAEWPTDLTVCKWGYVDYALFAGQKLVGVVEATADRRDISASIDNQCREYSMGIKEEHMEYVIGTWGAYKAPFLFATNGRAFIRQLETNSGVWFRDARDDANIPRALQGWIAPQGLLEMLESDIPAADRKLAESPYDMLCDEGGLNLRPYQIEAIEKTEGSVVEGRKAVLLTMATGTGKTRTALGMIYRFLKTGRFRRILFLVDHAALVEPALGVFKEVKVEGNMTLEQIYDIETPGNNDTVNDTCPDPDMDTSIHVSTAQDLVKHIVYNDTESMPSVTDYDLIVVDETNQGYVFERATDGDGQLYRSQGDYISKYRSVVEYFDAVKIVLTSTPAPHKTEIFGKPVFEYS